MRRAVVIAVVGIICGARAVTFAASPGCGTLPESIRGVSAANPGLRIDVNIATGEAVYVEAAVAKNHWPQLTIEFSIDHCKGSASKGEVNFFFKTWTIKAGDALKCHAVGKRSKSDVWKFGGNYLSVDYRAGHLTDAVLMIDEYSNCSPNVGSIPDLTATLR